MALEEQTTTIWMSAQRSAAIHSLLQPHLHPPTQMRLPLAPRHHAREAVVVVDGKTQPLERSDPRTSSHNQPLLQVDATMRSGTTKPSLLLLGGKPDEMMMMEHTVTISRQRLGMRGRRRMVGGCRGMMGLGAR